MKGVVNMTVSQELKSKELIITFTRLNDQGKNMGELRRIKNFKVTALPEDIHEVAMLVADLSEQTFEGVSVQDISRIQLV